MWARIENGTVMELTDVDPSGRFHPSLTWVECDESVTPRMLYVDGQFTAAAAPTEQAQEG
ncbi:hypothetical protein MAJJADAN_00044 [Pseudomonas phage Amjad_SA]|nr:hypothetical protein MAJJADAN_00044 [Pseudomonas phage Amjad_SA]